MADPKYANLPGIDTSETDSYECGDLPEEDQSYIPAELNSEAVELCEIDTAKSFSKFNSKYVSGDNVDFSDRIKGQGKTGYDIVLAGDKANESPLEKLQRLKLEVVDLHKSVSDLSKNKQAGDASAVELLSDVENLSRQIMEGDIEKKVNEVNTLASSYNKLSAVLDSMKTADPKTNKSCVENFASYNILIRPESVQEKQNVRTSQLEQRLANIEKVLGSNTADLGLLTAGTKSKTLQEAVENLEVKMNLLDPEKLPQVDTRLQAVLNKLVEINKAKKQPGVETEEINKKVSFLYETVQKWLSVADVLPEILERLEALNELHQHASQFSSTLKNMEMYQSEISSKLLSASSVQTDLHKSFAENNKCIQNNVSALEKRIQALSK